MSGKSRVNVKKMFLNMYIYLQSIAFAHYLCTANLKTIFFTFKNLYLN